MSGLRAEGLTARYAGQPRARPALIDISIDVRPGERLLLVGPNGAGKSTFIRVFAGLMHATGGKALVAGRPAREARANVGVVSHATYLYDELTSLENLGFYGELYGVAEPRRRAAQLLEQLRIEHLAGVQIGRLSRGQQQRVAIARALMHDPPLLLLDEPDAGLDLTALEVLAALLVDTRRTVVLTTHNLSTGLRLATRIGVLSRGHLVESTSASVLDATRLGELLVDLA